MVKGLYIVKVEREHGHSLTCYFDNHEAARVFSRTAETVPGVTRIVPQNDYPFKVHHFAADALDSLTAWLR